MWLTGNYQTDLDLLSKIDDETLLNLCMIDHKAKDICTRDDLWKTKLIQIRGLPQTPIDNYQTHYLKFKQGGIYELPKGKTYLEFLKEAVLIIQSQLDHVGDFSNRTLKIKTFLDDGSFVMLTIENGIIYLASAEVSKNNQLFVDEKDLANRFNLISYQNMPKKNDGYGDHAVMYVSPQLISFLNETDFGLIDPQSPEGSTLDIGIRNIPLKDLPGWNSRRKSWYEIKDILTIYNNLYPNSNALQKYFDHGTGLHLNASYEDANWSMRDTDSTYFTVPKYLITPPNTKLIIHQLAKDIKFEVNR